MDANGTRYHLLLGTADWLACRWSRDGSYWQPLAGAADASAEWNAESAELMLRRRAFRFDAARNDTPPDLTRNRRGAAADRFGNWYWINAAADGLRVRSRAGPVSDFWPVAPAAAAPARSFAPVQADAPVTLALGGLAVTSDHHLVVGTRQPAGLLVFDLYGGGAPRQLLWPEGVAFTPFDMVAGPSGGVWILDRVKRQLWALDRHFGLARKPAEPAPAAPTFEPSDGSPATQPAPQVVADPVLLDAADPVAVDLLADGSVIVLDRGVPPSGAQFLVVRDGRIVQRLVTDDMMAGGRPVVLDGYDMVCLPDTRRLLVVDAGGNQAFAFRLDGGGSQPLTLTPLPDYLPMRRFGGRGLALSAGLPHYDFADAWVPLVCQPQPRHETLAWVLTPAFDGREPECVWHRVFIDGAIPPDCRVQVWSRTAEDPALLADAPWFEEPPLYRRGDGSELPFRDLPGPARRQGEGTWELLLQRSRGRYAQLRLLLTGNERQSPRLRALRIYYPRFSYLNEYLPAVYREDAESADFLDGFLANIEGFNTAIEDRIAAAPMLLDWRTAPPEALDWLAGWLGVALDPAWDEARRRLFIRHAMLFFQYRGTAHGLRLALSLALDDSVDERRFAAPERVCETRFGVRLIEKYRTRHLPDVLFGDPRQLETPAAGSVQPWIPRDGGAELRRRWAAVQVDRNVVPPEFPMVQPGDAALAALWASFCEAALGFTPYAATLERQSWQDVLAASFFDIDALNRAWQTQYESFDAIAQPTGPGLDEWTRHMRDPAPARTPVERRAWQDFLRSRYSTVTRLNAAWSCHWPALDLVPLPDRLPADGAALDDWFQFESAVLAMRGTAHRFSVLLPMPLGPGVLPDEPQRRLDLARRIVALEKPAHTVFDLRFYWAMFRVGEARLGRETVLDEGVRERLMSPLVLGCGFLGQDHVGPTLAEAQRDRPVIGRDRLTN